MDIQASTGTARGGAAPRPSESGTKFWRGVKTMSMLRA